MKIAENAMNIGPITENGIWTRVVMYGVNMNNIMSIRSAIRPVKVSNQNLSCGSATLSKISHLDLPIKLLEELSLLQRRLL
jgi:hypothetical protein